MINIESSKSKKLLMEVLLGVSLSTSLIFGVSLHNSNSELDDTNKELKKANHLTSYISEQNRDLEAKLANVVDKNDRLHKSRNELKSRVRDINETTLMLEHQIAKLKLDILKQKEKKQVAVVKERVNNAKVSSVGNEKGSNKGHLGWKSLNVEATGYTAYCNGCSGITATGINLRTNPNQKVIAVDPRVIPLGSKVYVEGYGYAIAGDTGGAIKGNRIDLYMTNKNSALQWGRRNVKMYIQS